MVKSNPNKIKLKFTRTFIKPKKTKVNKQLHDRRSTMNDEEILRVRKQFNITPKAPQDLHGYPKDYYEQK